MLQYNCTSTNSLWILPEETSWADVSSVVYNGAGVIRKGATASLAWDRWHIAALASFRSKWTPEKWPGEREEISYMTAWIYEWRMVNDVLYFVCILSCIVMAVDLLEFAYRIRTGMSRAGKIWRWKFCVYLFFCLYFYWVTAQSGFIFGVYSTN